ncbi:porin [Motiliproteus sediminis]|uniref:porin n=1 Tax=Motiliproteus sediminis TaxID=1468178 RepID=UPI001AEF692D|nr:porin [Motiliproteus sediminis]
MTVQKRMLATAVAATMFSAPVLAEVDVKFSGHINRAVMFFDDGEESQVRHVDNDASSTRFRINGSTTVDTTTVGVNIELQAESQSTAVTNQDKSASDGFDVGERILEFTVADSWGKLSVGQGSTATDGTSEKDLSGTALAGYASTVDIGGGLIFRAKGDTATVPSSGITVGSALSDMDGNGRQDRLRYDSPSFSGLSIAASHSDEGTGDIGLHYSAQYDGMKVAAGLGYVDFDGGNNDTQTAGSVSVALDGGFNVTAAVGERDVKVGKDSDFIYLKLGYRMGHNAYSVDYHVTDQLQAGHEGSSYGAQYVRTIPAFSTEAYVGVRNYELDDDSGATDYEDVLVALVGARVKF